MTRRLWVFAVLIFLSGPVSALVTQLPKEDCSVYCWRISGSISMDDVRVVTGVLERMRAENETPFFLLDSEGGDVEAAISIGRLFRKMSAHVFVQYRVAKCFSACVFIYAGAIHRNAERIGIHRPFSLTTKQRTYDEIQVQQRRLNAIAKAFLEEMNVSPRLLEAMNRVSPEEIRVLSSAEMEEFGLGAVDPVQQEFRDAENAREYGLSMQEFFRRKAIVQTICGLPFFAGPYFAPSYTSCRDGIMRGNK